MRRTWQRDYRSGELVHRLGLPDGTTATVRPAANDDEEPFSIGWNWDIAGPTLTRQRGWECNMRDAQKAAVAAIVTQITHAMTKGVSHG